MRTSTHVLAVILLAAGLAAPGANAAEEATPPAASPARGDIGHAMRFRADFAFPADRGTAEAAAVDITGYPDMAWGVPLSRAEAAEMQRRLRLGEAMGPAVTRARSDPAWAGWWMDHASGGVPVLLFAGEPQAKAAEIEGLLPAGTVVRVEAVARSWADLEKLRDTIIARIDTFAGRGITLTAIGIDTIHNRLRISVEQLTDEATVAIRADIDDTFVLEQDGAAAADDCPATECTPLKAGIGITDQRTSDPNSPCTIGYLAKRYDTDPDRLVAVTAGHCIVVGSSHDPWRHGGVDIGSTAQKNGADVHTWHNHWNADVGLINTNLTAVTDRNDVLIDAPSETAYDFSRTLAHEDTYVGMPVCRMGRRTGRMCGEVVLTDDSRKSELSETNYVWIDHCVVYDVDALGGDSGAPIYHPVGAPYYYYEVLIGTHVHSWNDPNRPDFLNPDANGWYSPQDWGDQTLMNHLGVNIAPCLTDGCGL